MITPIRTAPSPALTLLLRAGVVRVGTLFQR